MLSKLKQEIYKFKDSIVDLIRKYDIIQFVEIEATPDDPESQYAN